MSITQPQADLLVKAFKYTYSEVYGWTKEYANKVIGDCIAERRKKKKAPSAPHK